MTVMVEWFVSSYNVYVKPCKMVKAPGAWELAHKAPGVFAIL